jgi:hypothetical protein
MNRKECVWLVKKCYIDSTFWLLISSVVIEFFNRNQYDTSLKSFIGVLRDLKLKNGMVMVVDDDVGCRGCGGQWTKGSQRHKCLVLRHKFL